MDGMCLLTTQLLPVMDDVRSRLQEGVFLMSVELRNASNDHFARLGGVANENLEVGYFPFSVNGKRKFYWPPKTPRQRAPSSGTRQMVVLITSDSAHRAPRA